MLYHMVKCRDPRRRSRASHPGSASYRSRTGQPTIVFAGKQCGRLAALEPDAGHRRLHKLQIPLCRGRQILRALRQRFVCDDKPWRNCFDLPVPEMRDTFAAQFSFLRPLRTQHNARYGAAHELTAFFQPTIRSPHSATGRACLPTLPNRVSAAHKILRPLRFDAAMRGYTRVSAGDPR